MKASTDHLRALYAGALYTLVVLAIGFVLGTIRLLLIVPRVGHLVGVLMELPVILILAWIVCGWVIAKTQVPRGLLPRLTMSVAAFSLLLAAETALSTWLFGNSVGEYFASFKTAHGAIGLGGQVVFGLFPVAQLLGQHRR